MIFAKVIEAHSFSEAARRLKMPLSAVSRRVAGLEDQLGVRLLERSTRSLRLTDVGSEVFEYAQSVAELSEAVDYIASNHLARVFRIGELKDATLVARKILTYRHQLLASPAYLANCKSPRAPQDLAGHRLLAFSRWQPENRWTLAHVNGKDKETLTFQP